MAKPVVITKRYMQAVSALYGNGVAPKARKKPRNHEERDHQIRLVNWMDDNGVLFYAVPNDGERTEGAANIAMLTGLRRGVPDLCIPVPTSVYAGDGSKTFHGLYIELKRAGGGVISEHQKDWIDKLNKNGYFACCCHGFDEAKKTIEWYLGM